MSKVSVIKMSNLFSIEIVGLFIKDKQGWHEGSIKYSTFYNSRSDIKIVELASDVQS